MELQYFDEMHKKNNGGKAVLNKILLVLGCIIISFIILVFNQWLFGLAFALIAAAIYGTYILMRNMNEEYEYIFTDGEVDIDVIRGRAARKRMITIKPKDVEVMAKITGGLYESYKSNSSITKKLDFSDNILHHTYFVIINGTGGKRLVLISPSQRLIDAMRFYIRDRMK